MADSFQVEGTNANAPFTLKIHRGDCMALLAMNWRNGKPPRDFVGFAIDYREPKGDRFYPLPNRLAFPGTKNTGNGFGISSRVAPIQKFRWVHFPRFGDLEGDFHYRVTAVFMNAQKELSYSEAQEAVVALRRETHPGKLNVTFTRGFISSQAFVNRFQPDGEIITLVPPHGKEGLSFKPTHKRATEAYRWMGLEAREAILNVLDEAIAKKAEVRVIAYDLNLPEILERLEKIGPRLKVIIDDSTGDGGGHKAADSPESKSAKRLMKTAGKSNVVRQNMANLQHHKAIAVSAPGYQRVVYGSTNFTWRGMFVQNNNALIVQGTAAVTDFFTAFDTYFAAEKAADFKNSDVAAKWHSLGLEGIDADVAFSPHAKEKGLLAGIAKDIDAATSSVLFSLAFLGQTKKGEVGPAIGRVIAKKNVFSVGIADQRVGAANLGVAVVSPDGKKKIVRSESLTGKVPLPFKSEPTGLSGVKGNERGTRMHHKFVVLDFDTDKACVYLGSYNFSVPADQENGENLVRIRDRHVATSYMIEALRIYDHYRFRVRWKESKDKGTTLTLKEAPSKPSDKPWWHADWQDSDRIADRRLFA